MTELNEGQEKIATTLDGVVVVDAGPGTGKTHTIVKRYLNILKKKIDPAEILMLTFTNNAAAEMEERVKSEIAALSHDLSSVRASTFDSFCLKAVMESPETVSGFFKTKETLTRGARLVQNETLDEEYFRNVYTRFIRRYGHMYGNIPAIIGTSYEDLYSVIQKLMSAGIAPTHDGGWFGRDVSILTGNTEKLASRLSDMKKVSEHFKEKKSKADLSEEIEVTAETIRKAVTDPRKELLFFVNGVYYEFIRSSISDNRLTFGLTALFAFIILYANPHVRKMMSFRYVMIDEFQDTNELHFLIALLILKQPNLCVVGDWKQGIYGFRYASIENITDFKNRLKVMIKFLNKGEKRTVEGITAPAKRSLTENYRSTQKVIDASFGSLWCETKDNDESVDREWLEKNVTMLTAKKDHGYSRIERLAADGEENEILAILQKMSEYVRGDEYSIPEYDADGNATKPRAPRYGDIAVLCRNGSMCIKIKEAADKYGIPVHLQGDVDIMSAREGKLALAWLRYINNENDIRGPLTILTDAGYSLAELQEMFPKRRGTDGVPAELKEQRKRLKKKKGRINSLLTAIFGYHNLNNDITQSIISTISSAHGSGMLTVSEIIRMMESDMRRSTKYTVDASLDGLSVTIQTMHKSKGLEYPIVIIGGLNTNMMPSTKNTAGVITFDPLYGLRLTKEYVIRDGHHKIYDCWKWKIVNYVTGPDRNGERRLFFVALSRAKQYITMTCRRGKESMFIKEICKGSIDGIEPRPEMITPVPPAGPGERPDIAPYEKRKKRISLHEVMGEYEESGGGKGEEHGKRVHKDAQRIMSGLRPSAEDDDTGYIKKVYDSVKKGKIMTEADCSLPLGDTVVAGRIDMLAVFDDRVEVHDWKTDMNNVNEHRYRIQLSVYAHAAASLGRPVKAVIDYVSQGRSVTVDVMGIDELKEKLASMDL